MEHEPLLLPPGGKAVAFLSHVARVQLGRALLLLFFFLLLDNAAAALRRILVRCGGGGHRHRLAAGHERSRLGQRLSLGSRGGAGTAKAERGSAAQAERGRVPHRLGLRFEREHTPHELAEARTSSALASTRLLGTLLHPPVAE